MYDDFDQQFETPRSKAYRLYDDFSRRAYRARKDGASPARIARLESVRDYYCDLWHRWKRSDTQAALAGCFN